MSYYVHVTLLIVDDHYLTISILYGYSLVCKALGTALTKREFIVVNYILLGSIIFQQEVHPGVKGTRRRERRNELLLRLVCIDGWSRPGCRYFFFFFSHQLRFSRGSPM